MSKNTGSLNGKKGHEIVVALRVSIGENACLDRSIAVKFKRVVNACLLHHILHEERAYARIFRRIMVDERDVQIFGHRVQLMVREARIKFARQFDGTSVFDRRELI